MNQNSVSQRDFFLPTPAKRAHVISTTVQGSRWTVIAALAMVLVLESSKAANFTLNLFTHGGGIVSANPSGSTFPSNTVVTVTATPSFGFSFMGWSGDIGGNNPSNSVVMNGPKSVEAIFGTTVITKATGNGSIFVHPAPQTFPYGYTVAFSAVPNNGSFFAHWGNAASGTQSPLLFAITNAEPTISAIFTTLPANTVSLVLLMDGPGSVNVNATSNDFTLGSTNVLTAIPATNQQFLGWSGDATGTSNPLSIVMDANKTVTAIFSHTPQLKATSSGSFIMLTATGVPGDTFNFVTSPDLINWYPFGYAETLSGTFSLLYPVSLNTPMLMFRVYVQ